MRRYLEVGKSRSECPTLLSAFAAEQSDIVTFPKAVLVHMLNKQITKHVRPPTKKHRGKRLREAKPLLTTASVWQEQLSIANGLPWEVSVGEWSAVVQECVLELQSSILCSWLQPCLIGLK